MSVARVTEITASSPKNFENPIDRGLKRTSPLARLMILSGLRLSTIKYCEPDARASGFFITRMLIKENRVSLFLSALRSSLDDAAIEEISRQLGQAVEATARAIDSALPMLVSALSRSTRIDCGAGLVRALDERSDVKISGDAVLALFLGDIRDAAAQLLGKSSGIGAAPASELLVILAPIVLDAVHEYRCVQNLGAFRIAQLLQSEEHDIGRRAPDIMNAVWTLLDTDRNGVTEVPISRRVAPIRLNRFLRGSRSRYK